MDRSKRNRLLIAILAIAMFIPTVIAIISYTREKNGPVDTKSVVSVTLTDLSGNSFVYDNTSPEKEVLVDHIMKMKDKGVEITVLPDAVTGKTPYKATLNNGSVDYVYDFYFDTSGNKSYYWDYTEDKAYSLEANDVADFFRTEYAESLFPEASYPVLTISASNTAVAAKEASWAFKAPTGEAVFVDCSSRIDAADEKYEVEGGFKTSFDKAPDFLHVEVTDSVTGETMFNGDYSNGEAFMFDSSAEAKVTINAKWYHDDTRSYEGELKYDFSIVSTDPAAFYIGAKEIQNGELVSVTATNVKDPDAIVFKCEPSITSTPVFYRDGDYVRGLIAFPIDCQAELNGTAYKLTFEYGATKQVIDLSVSFRNYQNNVEVDYTVTDEKAALYSQETEAEVDAALEGVLGAKSDAVYFDGEPFVESATGNITRFFGRSYTVKPGDKAYRQLGIEYATADGAGVVAGAKGKVIYVGSFTLTGNLVVVDHGYGLRTVYAHLDSASVAVGDVVEKGAAIGVAGSTGFTNTTGVYVRTYVGTTPVSPYIMWNDGNWITFPAP